jgi:uncharacterized protein (DUF952 family)
MIYRIAEENDWKRVQQTGEFASADLKAEGFIHCSEQHQILRTAQKYYSGKKGLVLLEIDEGPITACLKREDSTGRGEMFPHVFAPIPIAAITRHFDFMETDGVFVLPF